MSMTSDFQNQATKNKSHTIFVLTCSVLFHFLVTGLKSINLTF